MPKSSIDLLSQELRDRLNALLARPEVTQQEITDAINAAAGETVVSKSAVNRYAVKMKRFGERARQIKEATAAYMEMAGSGHADVSETIIHQLRIALYDLASAMDSSSDEDEDGPKEIAQRIQAVTQASRGMRDLESAAKAIDERRRRLKAELAAAAENIQETARSAGLSDETAKAIGEQVLGVSID